MKKYLLTAILATFTLWAFTNANPANFLDFLAENEPRLSQKSRLRYDQDQQIVDFLHAIGMTKFPQIKDFMPHQSISRAEASKFFVKFADNTGIFTKNKKTDSICEFSDIAAYKKQDLYQTMLTACEYGLFQGSEWKFNPEGKLSFAEAITVAIRMLDGKLLEESPIHRSLNYLNQAHQYRLILTQLQKVSAENLDPLGFPISRLDLGRLLEGVHFKKTLDKQLSTFFARTK